MRIRNPPQKNKIKPVFDSCPDVQKDNWGKVFKNEPSKICGRQPLKIFTSSILEYFVPFYLFKNNGHLAKIQCPLGNSNVLYETIDIAI